MIRTRDGLFRLHDGMCGFSEIPLRGIQYARQWRPLKCLRVVIATFTLHLRPFGLLKIDRKRILDGKRVVTNFGASTESFMNAREHMIFKVFVVETQTSVFLSGGRGSQLPPLAG